MKGQDDNRALGRIVSMLLALAALAERAGGAPYPVRCLVLLILRIAEAVAGNFVREVAQMPPGIVDCPAFPQDNSFTALLRLAMRFRARAAALAQMLSQPPRVAQDIHQLHGAAGARPVVFRLNERAAIGRPGSRAPPFRFQKSRQALLQSRNGCLERLGVSDAAAPQEVRGDLQNLSAVGFSSTESCSVSEFRPILRLS